MTATKKKTSPSARRHDHRYVVTDTETGRTGHAEQHPGYLLGGSYVNPYWTVTWDSPEPDESDPQ